MQPQKGNLVTPKGNLATQKGNHISQNLFEHTIQSLGYCSPIMSQLKNLLKLTQKKKKRKCSLFQTPVIQTSWSLQAYLWVSILLLKDKKLKVLIKINI